MNEVGAGGTRSFFFILVLSFVVATITFFADSIVTIQFTQKGVSQGYSAYLDLLQTF